MLRYVVAAACVLIAVGIVWAAGPALTVIKDPTTSSAKQSVLDNKVKGIDGKEVDLAQYKGKVVLIVNVASKCGNTPQYKGLEALYKKFADKGLVIVGFPANDFGRQEPGTDEEIKTFCTTKYDVTFPMMSKISTKTPDKAAVYKFLTEKETAGDFAGEVEWNFTKFLVDRNGNLIARFGNRMKPEDEKIVGEVEKALEAKAAK